MIRFGALSVAIPDLLTFLFSGSSLVILLVVLFRTKIGLAIRSTSFDTATAKLMGMDPNRVVAAAFFCVGRSGRRRGCLPGNQLYTLPAARAAYCKRVRRLRDRRPREHIGALICAVPLGVVEIFLIGLVGAGWSPVVIFVIMLVFLLLRPRGISGVVIVQEKRLKGGFGWNILSQRSRLRASPS